jgi:hypothetical protein
MAEGHMYLKSGNSTWKAALSPREFENLLSRAAELTKSAPLRLVKRPQAAPKPKRPAA